MAVARAIGSKFSMLPIRFAIAVTMLLAMSAGCALGGEPWYFTADEIRTAHRYQENFGRRLNRPLKAVSCLNNSTEFVASFRGNEFLAPCRFITETIRHLQEILEQGAARYLFPLDADHAHLAIPSTIWERKYSQLPSDKVLPDLLWEPALAALYHTAEHLTATDPKTGQVGSDAQAWKEKRNVLGFYDGRPVKILPHQSDGSGQRAPESYTMFGSFNFLAHRLGELEFSSMGKRFAFDISFDDDFAAD